MTVTEINYITCQTRCQHTVYFWASYYLAGNILDKLQQSVNHDWQCPEQIALVWAHIRAQINNIGLQFGGKHSAELDLYADKN